MTQLQSLPTELTVWMGLDSQTRNYNTVRSVPSERDEGVTREGLSAVAS
jgi:hypothetical protein